MDSLRLGCFSRSTLLSFPVAAEPFTGVPKGHHAAIKISTGKVGNILQRNYFSRLQLHLTEHNHRYNETKFPIWQKCCRYRANASSDRPLESEPKAYDPKDSWEAVKSASQAFYRFSRPHTVIGTALSIVSVSLLAVEKLSDVSSLFFTGVLQAVAAALFMNIYIVGLNQLTDIDIDKVNKPYLPLASGEYSFGTGVLIVTLFSIMSFCLAWVVGSGPLFWALFISFVLGTAYSINLPLLRWKRFALVAAMCIIVVRAVIVQLAFYLHMQISS